MRRSNPLILLAALVFAVVLWQRHASTPVGIDVPDTAAPTGQATAGPDPSSRQSSAALPSFLPSEASDTLDAIARGGPFAHRQDGVVFGNYEHLLPQQPRGYYHEYTVETPGAGTRGARRIITGGTPPAAWYYTDDHYRSFRRFEWHP